jgi:hypothetical protein
MTALRYKDPTTGQWVDIEIGGGTSIWSGTQAEYDAIPVKDPAVLYVIEGEGGVSWITQAAADARYARTTGVEGDFHVPGAVFVGSEAALMGAPDGGAQIVNEDVTGLDTLRVAAPTDLNHAVTKQYTDANYVNVTGDTMTGGLMIQKGSSLHPGKFAIQEHGTNGDLYVTLPGVANIFIADDETGLVRVTGNPTAELGIATKQYVDGRSVNGVDMNTVKAPGQYYGYNMTNSAKDNAISVFTVQHYSNDWIVQRQTLIGASPRTFERHFHSGTTWGPWVPQEGGWVSVATTLRQGNNVAGTITQNRYTRIGDTVHWECRIEVTGAGTAGQAVEVDIPLPAATANGIPIGQGRITMDGTKQWPCLVILNTGAGRASFKWMSDQGNNFGIGGGSGTSVALAAGNQVVFSATYEAA